LAKSNPYVEFLLEALRPLGVVTARPMFGGYGLYCDAVFFALVANNALFLKADDLNRPAFEERRLLPFRPYEDRPEIMQYYEAPAEIFEDTDALKLWVGGAVAAGRRAQEKRKPRPAKARAKKRS
jgi:DNA transformation protein and related proteins